MATINLTQEESTISVRQGTTLDLAFTFSIKSSTTGSIVSPVDVSEYEFRFNLKKATEIKTVSSTPVLDSDEDAAAYNLPKTSSSVTILDGPAGKFRLYLSAIYIKNLKSGDWVFEIDYITENKTVSTFLNGTFTVEKDIK